MWGLVRWSSRHDCVLYLALNSDGGGGLYSIVASYDDDDMLSFFLSLSQQFWYAGHFEQGAGAGLPGVPQGQTDRTR